MSVTPRQKKTPREPACADELRCACSRLVARRVPQGIELRCGRCKQPILIRIEDGLILEVVIG